ncbi:MAG: deoxyribose-phosphate aldolase [Anaerovoracaceae bacterium]|jgi:deoxyribose-phosphate aldolase
MKPFAKYFDHTLLQPDADADDIRRLCEEALQYDFASVCVNSCRVRLAHSLLADSDVAVTSVVGFPLGAMHRRAKAREAALACRDGADEIDMVLNIGALRDGEDDLVRRDIAGVAGAIGRQRTLKVILETHLLTAGQLDRACRLAVEAGADFVKTSTGFSGGGATVEAVRAMRESVGSRARIKASGGIRDLDTALALIDAGADRLGASASAAIMKEYLRRG